MKNVEKLKNKDINNNMKNQSSKKTVLENVEIVSFIRSISQKNYSEANKYLQSVVDSKLKGKINDALKEKVF